MNDIFAIVVSVGMLLLFVGIIIYSVITSKKIKEASWEGVVVDKAIKEQVHDTSMNRNNDNDGVSLISLRYTNRSQSSVAVTHSYFMTVRPSSGESFEWEITSGSYENISIGDKVAKKSGDLAINIIEKAAPSSSPLTTPAQAAVPAQALPVQTLTTTEQDIVIPSETEITRPN